MDATITKRSATSYTIEIEIPYEYSSMLEAETVIQTQVNNVGTLATGEALKQFDTDGAPVFVEGQKLTSKGQISKPYQTPYGDVTIDRHVYQSSQGGRGDCPLEYRARIITTATPKYAKMVASKYADGSGLRVQKDLQENHGRSISRSHIQQICDVVGSIASVKETSWNDTLPRLDAEVASVSIGVDGTGMLMCDDGARHKSWSGPSASTMPRARDSIRFIARPVPNMANRRSFSAWIRKLPASSSGIRRPTT